MNKYIETANEGLGNKGNSRINVYISKAAEVILKSFRNKV
jgi:hypothetical protein